MVKSCHADLRALYAVWSNHQLSSPGDEAEDAGRARGGDSRVCAPLFFYLYLFLFHTVYLVPSIGCSMGPVN